MIIRSKMCSFCAAGLANPDLVLSTEDVVLPTGNQITCAQAQAYSSSFAEIDLACQMVIKAESLCCPPTITTTNFDELDAPAPEPHYGDLDASEPETPRDETTEEEGENFAV